MALFDELDKDHSGTVTLQEFKGFELPELRVAGVIADTTISESVPARANSSGRTTSRNEEF